MSFLHEALRRAHAPAQLPPLLTGVACVYAATVVSMHACVYAVADPGRGGVWWLFCVFFLSRYKTIIPGTVGQ